MPPYNGSGTYTLTAGQPVVAGTDILDSTFNTLTADLATALSTCVTRDGQSPPTTNLPMGSFKLTGLAAGTAAGHSVRFEQLQTGANKLITVAGTGDVITGVMTPTYGAYTNGDMFTFIVGSTNTTNVTINIDGLGAKAITNGTTALTAGELTASRVVVVQYDGTQFQLLNSYFVTTATGTGNLVRATSPTLVTPLLGTPTSGVATNLTGLPLTTGVTGTLPVANGGTGLTSIAHTVQTFTSGSGTYTLPTGCKAIKVTMVAGGGGGSGGGIASIGAGGAGGNTTFGSNTAYTGAGGGVPNSGGAAGGSYTLVTGSGYGIVGMSSNDGSVTTTGNAVACGVGSSGGGTPFGSGGGGGAYVTTGRAASSNTGAGGGGGAGGNAIGTLLGGTGGGGGGYLMSLIASPSATYSYAIGAGGTAGTAGTGSNASAGGAGGAGFILVEEFYV